VVSERRFLYLLVLIIDDPQGKKSIDFYSPPPLLSRDDATRTYCFRIFSEQISVSISAFGTSRRCVSF
jgi:hypothetical protein